MLDCGGDRTTARLPTALDAADRESLGHQSPRQLRRPVDGRGDHARGLSGKLHARRSSRRRVGTGPQCQLPPCAKLCATEGGAQKNKRESVTSLTASTMAICDATVGQGFAPLTRCPCQAHLPHRSLEFHGSTGHWRSRGSTGHQLSHRSLGVDKRVP